MFIKVTQTAGRRYAQLVESYRNEEGKPRQRTICTLGRLDSGAEVDHLIAALQKAKGQSPRTASLEGLRFLASKDVGDVWALHQLWLDLGCDRMNKNLRNRITAVFVGY